MSSTTKVGSRASLGMFLIFAASILTLLSPVAPWHTQHGDTHSVGLSSTKRLLQQSTNRTGVPFGVDDYTHSFTVDSRQSKLVKRVVDDATYHSYVCKGSTYLDAIVTGPRSERVWAQQDLDNGGWEIQQDIAEVSEDLEPALQGLGIPHGADDIRPVFADQYRPFSRNGNPDNPATRAGEQAGNLRYVFRDKVVNDMTRGIMEYITGVETDTLDLPWPGRTYDMRTNDGKALLGTPYGVGIAYLLKDHSDVLGRKIPLARVFTVSNAPSPLSDGDADRDGDDDDDEDNDGVDDAEDEDDDNDGVPDEEDSDNSSEAESSSSGDSSPGPYAWTYYMVWEFRDIARGDNPPQLL
ncbi:MAG: hypothetical protein Q9166_005158 [cf. Caloplaca sp. 2 TL-2023]